MNKFNKVVLLALFNSALQQLNAVGKNATRNVLGFDNITSSAIVDNMPEGEFQNPLMRSLTLNGDDWNLDKCHAMGGYLRELVEDECVLMHIHAEPNTAEEAKVASIKDAKAQLALYHILNVTMLAKVMVGIQREEDKGVLYTSYARHLPLHAKIHAGLVANSIHHVIATALQG